MSDPTEARITELTTPDGFTARPARPEDLPGMARAIEAAFDHWPPVETGASTLSYLEWKLGAPDGRFVVS